MTSSTAPILGVRTFAQLEDNLGALSVQLSNEQRTELAAVSHFEKGFPHDFLDSPTVRQIVSAGASIRDRG